MGILSFGNNTLLRPGNSGTVNHERLVVSDGLFAYWPLDGSTFSSTKIEADISRYRRHATRYHDVGNGPDSYDLEMGRALRFTGDQTTNAPHVRLPAGGVIQGLRKFSISLFYYPLSTPGNNSSLFYQDTGVPGYTCVGMYHLADDGFNFGTRDTQTDTGHSLGISGFFSSNKNRWHHFAGTYNADAVLMTLWANGQLMGINTTAPMADVWNSPPAQVPCIGAYSNYDGGNLFTVDGYIRDVRVYNRDLGVSEILELYTSGRYGMRTKYVGATRWDLPPVTAGIVVAYLRPDADDSISDWKNEADGTTNLYASIDESVAGDTDYIKSPNPPNASVARFRMSNPAAGKTLVTPVTISYRFKKTTSTDQKLTASLKQDTTLIKSWTHTGAGLTTSFQTVNQALSSGEIAAITNFNNLFVEFKAEGTAPNFWDAANKGVDISVSSDGSVASQSGGAANNGSNIRSIVGQPTGGTYQFSVTVAGGTFAAEGMAIGFGNEYYANGIVAPGRWPGGGATSHSNASIAIWNDGVVYMNANVMATYFTYASGDKITCWVNYTTASTAKVSFKRNNDNWNNNAANDPTVGSISWTGDGTLAYALIAVDTNCSTAALSPGWF